MCEPDLDTLLLSPRVASLAILYVPVAVAWKHVAELYSGPSLSIFIFRPNQALVWERSDNLTSFWPDVIDDIRICWVDGWSSSITKSSTMTSTGWSLEVWAIPWLKISVELSNLDSCRLWSFPVASAPTGLVLELHEYTELSWLDCSIRKSV
jgi:hypothetical protein